ncbi:DUF1266 domain-containing protein [Mesobacillus zeae]|nr:DUF1266 domain-containing protein [Mesobacillus zeae]
MMKYRHPNMKKSYALENLAESEITDSESAAHSLYSFLAAEYNEEFHRMRNILLTLAEAERTQYIKAIQDEEEAYKYSIVRLYMNRLPVMSIAAYDYSVCIMRSQEATAAGYISKEESTEFQIQAARKSQETFSNWSEYIVSYTAGVQFGSINTKEDAMEYMAHQEDSITKLLTARHSPLLTVDWNTDLSHY